MQYTFFDLFSGIGGFRSGLENAGHLCVGSCEIDKYARQIYAKNFGSEPKWKDAREIEPSELPNFDILVAGFPCQAFSHAGKRLGFQDTRGTLFYEIARIAKQKRPRYLFLENVRGLLFHEKGETLTQIFSTLDELGYDCEWQVVNSKYFVPQSRDRIFIIGHLRGSGGRKIFPLGQDGQEYGSSRPTPQKSGQRTSKRHSSALTSSYHKGWGAGRTMIKVVPMIQIANKNSNTKNRQQNRKETWSLTGNSDDFGIIEKDQKPKKVAHLTPHPFNAVFDPDGISPSLMAGAGSGSRVRIADKPKQTKELYPKHHSHAGRVYDPNAIGRSLISSEGGVGKQTGLYEVGDRIRKLTPTECERLMGFPDGWTDHGISDTQRYKCLGNSVVVPVIEYIARRL